MRYVEKPWDNEALRLIIQNGLRQQSLARALRQKIHELDQVLTRLSSLEARDHSLRGELEMARRIQESILPAAPPALPGQAIESHDLPLLEVGGDFFDFHAGKDGRRGLLIADVVGHGIQAALITSMVKTVFKECAASGLAPAATLDHLNDRLRELLPAGPTGGQAGRARRLPLARTPRRMLGFLVGKGRQPRGVVVMTSKSKQRASARAARADAAAARTVIEVGAGIIQQHGKYLVSQRPEGSILGQCWEFPGGKREPGETIEECVVREIREELGIQVKVGKLWRVVERAFPERTVRLHFFLCTIESGMPRAIACQHFRWILPGEYTNYEFPPADLDIIQELARKSLRLQTAAAS